MNLPDLTFAVMVAATVLNVSSLVNYVRQSAKRARLRQQAHFEQFEKETALYERIEELENELDQVTRLDRPFHYTWVTTVSSEVVDGIEAWLADRTGEYEVKRHDYSAGMSVHLGLRRATSFKFSTEDKTLATLFKLTWAGAA